MFPSVFPLHPHLCWSFWFPLWDSVSQAGFYVNRECTGTGDTGWALSVSQRMEADGGPSCPDCLSLLQSRTPPKKNNWKQKHEALIHIMSQARQAQQTLAKGRKVCDLPLLTPNENPDYVACTYCGRKFAPRVAERHIPKCKNIKNRPPPPPQKRRWWGSAQLYLLLIFAIFPAIDICVFCSLNAGCKLLCTASEQLRKLNNGTCILWPAP